jgi:hypothetical protein
MVIPFFLLQFCQQLGILFFLGIVQWVNDGGLADVFEPPVFLPGLMISFLLP